MSRTSLVITRSLALGLAVSLLCLAAPPAADAGVYPNNKCLSAKQKAAGKFCQSAAKAWGKYLADPTKDPGSDTLDTAVEKAGGKLSGAFEKAETKALAKGSACDESTEDAETIGGGILSAIESLAGDIAAGVDGESKDDRKCRAKLTAEAGKLCSAMMKAEAKWILNPGKDADKGALADSREGAGAKFAGKYEAIVGKAGDAGVTCPDSIDDEGIIGQVDDAADAAVLQTIVSPTVSLGSFDQMDPVGPIPYQGEDLSPICSRGTPYAFFARRGTVNKLVMYYQGGGACWSGGSCNIAQIFKQTAGAGDDPDNVTTGFGDMDNPLNPFKDWHMVMVSYCTGDVHWGNAVGVYPGENVNHMGRVNAAVAEKFAREHFAAPEEVFVTGSSAGSYGAIFNSVYLIGDVYPAARFNVLGDAGTGVITTEWLATSIQNWGVQPNIPSWAPGRLGAEPIEDLGSVELWTEIANGYPNQRFAQYQSMYDGSGGGQAAFFNAMANPGDAPAWLRWWDLTCEWNACMLDQVAEIENRTSNFRSYTGTGSRHTIWGSDKVYTDTLGGVPTLVDWLGDMLDHDDAVSWQTAATSDAVSLVSTCQGGSNAGGTCTTDGDCPDGSCEHDPEPGGGDPSPPWDPYDGAGSVNCAPTICPCEQEPGGWVNCPDPL